MSTVERYIPALRYRWLTPLYDPFIRQIMHEQTFKTQLIGQLKLASGMHLLDIGCGTGTLDLMIKQANPQVEVCGLDGDPQVLELAREKAVRMGVKIELGLGMAYALPYPDEYFDRVISTLMMHHLTSENKERTLHEVFRVLKPGGALHVVDFGPPRNVYARFSTMVMKRLEPVGENVNGQLYRYIQSAGFATVTETSHFDTLAGTLVFYLAPK